LVISHTETGQSGRQNNPVDGGNAILGAKEFSNRHRNQRPKKGSEKARPEKLAAYLP
jgi:hypothetical protein